MQPPITRPPKLAGHSRNRGLTRRLADRQEVYDRQLIGIHRDAARMAKALRDHAKMKDVYDGFVRRVYQFGRYNALLKPEELYIGKDHDLQWGYSLPDTTTIRVCDDPIARLGYPIEMSIHHVNCVFARYERKSRYGGFQNYFHVYLNMGGGEDEEEHYCYACDDYVLRSGMGDEYITKMLMDEFRRQRYAKNNPEYSRRPRR